MLCASGIGIKAPESAGPCFRRIGVANLGCNMSSEEIEILGLLMRDLEMGSRPRRDLCSDLKEHLDLGVRTREATGKEEGTGGREEVVVVKIEFTGLLEAIGKARKELASSSWSRRRCRVTCPSY